jgi:hypothetical protein
VVGGPVNPPRMARWKRPVRAILRWLRIHGPLPEAPSIPRVRVPDFLKIMPANVLPGVILSIIPGLAHYIDGRFREIRWFVLGWFLLSLGGIFFYSGALGFLLLGLAIVLHGWIAFSHTLLAEKTEFGKRVIDYMAVLVILGLIYWGVQVVAFHDFVFGISTFTIPRQNVQTGDTLLARRSRAHDGVLPRGSLVVGNFRQLYGAHHVIRGTYETMGQVIALPGEKLEISENQFVVNDEAIDTEKLPVPAWLSGRRMSATIPPDSYFVSAVYQVQMHGMQLTDAMVCDVCILRAGDIEARAVLRWFPLARRGFLRAGE